MIIKVADIGNVSKGETYASSWTERVVQERQYETQPTYAPGYTTSMLPTGCQGPSEIPPERRDAS